jgi:FkbM family methyltransferase
VTGASRQVLGRGILAAIVLSCLALLLAVGPEVLAAAGVLRRPRDGCTLPAALAGGWQAVETLKHSDLFFTTSRVVERDPAGYVRWRTSAGDYWAPEKDFSLFYVMAELELEPYGEGQPELLRGKVVFDCGAHLGVFTRQALAAGAALVIAVEPGPAQVYCLRKTFAREIDAGRARVEPSGVWDREGKLELAAGRDTAQSSFTGLASGPTISVPVTTIDRLVASAGLKSVDFIKMDIEGAEPQALAGAAATLRTFRPRLAIASYHRPGDDRRVTAIVRKANPIYRPRAVGCRVDLGTSVPLTMMYQ